MNYLKLEIYYPTDLFHVILEFFFLKKLYALSSTNVYVNSLHLLALFSLRLNVVGLYLGQ